MKFSIVEVNIFENYVQEILKSNLHPHKYAEGPIKGQLWDSHFLDNMCPVPSLDEILDVLLIFNMCVLAHVNSLLPFEIYNKSARKRRLAVVDGGETPANFLFKNVKVFSFGYFIDAMYRIFHNIDIKYSTVTSRWVDCTELSIIENMMFADMNFKLMPEYITKTILDSRDSIYIYLSDQCFNLVIKPTIIKNYSTAAKNSISGYLYKISKILEALENLSLCTSADSYDQVLKNLSLVANILRKKI